MRGYVKTNWLYLLIAGVWIANGLFCKMLNLVPRHQQIVERILATNHPRLWTFLIGVAEVGMAIWILSGWKRNWSALTQICIIALMNGLEFFLAPDLLLWGRANIIYAFLFMTLIFYNEFHLKRQHVFIFKRSSVRGRGLL